MKKLIAMIGAVAMAFGLYAEGTPADNYYANSFEVEAEGVTDKTWSPEDANWATEQTEAFTLGDQDQTGLPYYTGAARRYNLFKGETLNNNFLKLETGTNTLARSIATDQVYFDQLVKFTGYEEDPTLADGTKIAVWLSAIEQEGTDPEAADYVAGETNLYVTVGTGSAATKVQIDPASVGLDEFLPDTWYRITIKSLGDVIANKTDYDIVNQIGFAIFINGKQAAIVDKQDYHAKSGAFSAAAKALYEKGQLFTAIDTSNATLAKVAYQGIGGVDDIIFSQEAPDFDSKVEFTVGAVPGVELVKVEDAEGVQLTAPYMVMPNSQVKIYVKAKDGYRIDNLPEGYITKTISAAGTVSIADDLAGKVVKGVVQVVNAATPSVTNVYAESELGTVLTGLKTGDTATVLESCEIQDAKENTLFGFTKNTTIAVPEANVWNVFIDNEEEETAGALYDNVGLLAGKTVSVDFADAIDEYNACELYLSGEIAGDITATAKGNVILADNDASTLSGTITAANVEVNNEVTLVDNGKLITQNDEIFEIVDGKGDIVDPVAGPEEGWFTYQIKQATGFAIIIADGDPVYYDTLEEAINDAMGVENAKVVILQDCEIASTITVTDDLSIELAEGVTVTTTADGQKAFLVIDDATLSVKGVTADDNTATTFNGRFTVGKRVSSGHGNPGNLVIDGGSYAVTGEQTVIHVNGDCQGADDDDCSVSIKNATITSAVDNAIQFNGKGTYAIKNSKVTGYTGIYLKAGTLTIDGTSEIVANGAKLEPSYHSGGSNKTGDAIVLDSVSGYKGEVSLDLAEGAKVTSENGYAVIETITKGGTSTTLRIADNGATLAGKLGGLSVTDEFNGEIIGYVAEVGGVCYKTLQAAVAAAGEGATVKLIANTTLDATLTVAKALAFNLNGKTVTFANTLTKGIDAAEAGDLVISNGMITVAAGRANIAYSRAIYLLHTSAAFKDLTLDLPGFEYVINKDCDLSPITACWSEPLQYTLECENVAINGNGSLFHIENANATLTGCATTFDTTLPSFGGAHAAAIYSSCGAVTTVDGGLFTAPNALQTGNLGGVIDVKGGEFNGNIMSFMYENDKRYTGNTATIKIEDGTFDGQFTFAQGQAGACTKECVNWDITGGKFSDNPTPYLTKDYTATYDGSKWYTVAQSAPTGNFEINGQLYATLAKAVEAAAAGDTIKLLADASNEVAVTIAKAITLNLGGFTLTEPATGMIQTEANVILTNGTFALQSSKNKHDSGIQLVSGKLVLAKDAIIDQHGSYAVGVNGGTFDIYGTILNPDSEQVCVNIYGAEVSPVINVYDGAVLHSNGDNFRTKGGDYTPNAQVYVYGGTLTADTGNYGSFRFYQSGDTTKATIIGGTFENTVVATDFKGAIDPLLTAENCQAKFKKTDRLAAWIAPGYGLVQGDDTYYTVQKVYNITIADVQNGTLETSVTNGVAAGTTVTVIATPAEGYKVKAITTNGFELAGTTFEMPAENVTVAATFEEEAQPVVPGADIDIPAGADPTEFAALIESKKDKLLKAPGDVETTPLYRSYFTATVVGTKVEFVLNKTGEDALQAQVNTDVTTADVAKDFVDATAGAATVTTTPGFYYYVVGGTEVGTIATKGERKLATTGSTELQKPALGTTTKAFYKIGVDYK